MNDLPKGWDFASVIELAGAGGLATDGDWVESKDQDPNGEVRLIQLADIGDGHFNSKSNRFMNTGTVERLKCTYLQEGDLLLARMPEPLGRACIFPQIGQPAVTAVDIFIWRPDEKLHGAMPRWLMHAVNSPHIRAVIASQAGGTTRQRIAGGKLREIQLPVPPLTEQKRIVEKIDNLISRTARARSDLDRIPALVEKYRARMMELGCSGNLTGEWRTSKGLSNLQEVRLGDVAQGFHYGTSSKSSARGDVPVLRMGNIQNGRLDWTKLVYTSNSEEIEKYRLQVGDVLFNRTNSPELVGKTAVYKGAGEAIFAGYLIRVKCGPQLLPDYLSYCLNGPAGRRYSWEMKSDGVSQSNINAKKLANFKLLLPALEEQIEIVRLIEAAFASLDRMLIDFGATANLLTRLDAAILQKAFSGTLVSQNEDDEPVSKLLQRIKAEREADGWLRKRSKASSPVLTTTKRKPAMANLNEVLNASDGWLSASEAAQKLGIGNGSTSDAVESFYGELRSLVLEGTVEVERRGDQDWLRLCVGKVD